VAGASGRLGRHAVPCAGLRHRTGIPPDVLFPTYLFDPACGGAAEESMTEQIKHTSDTSFEADVLKSDMPVLVDYWAEWCGPCKGIAPILAELSKEYSGRLTVAKMNVDENQTTPVKYNIRAIPTLMLFKNGAVVGTKVGQLSKSQLTAFIDSNI
jgi:thioredoxin 1